MKQFHGTWKILTGGNKLITLLGKNSQLGRSFNNIAKMDVDYISSSELDLKKTELISDSLLKYKNNKILINCAAYNDVEGAELSDDSMLINYYAVKELAKFCSKHMIFLIHISTDYVFDGKKGSYNESDLVNPINIYGKSKLLGEKAITDNVDNYLIIRTSWLYSHFKTKNNFLYKMLSRYNDLKKIYGAIDIIGSPTSSNSLAMGLEVVIDSIIKNQFIFHNKNKIFHFSDLGRVSRFEFVDEIIRNVNKKHYQKMNVEPINNSFFQLQAQRPADSSLDISMFCKTFKFGACKWDQALKETMKLI